MRPLFAAPTAPNAAAPTARARARGPEPVALALYQPGLSARQRLLARLGTSGTVSPTPGSRPVSSKGLVSVSAGAVVGMMVGQFFDPLTFSAPLIGFALGGGGGAAAWTAVRGRRAVVIVIDDWRPRLEAIAAILRDADAIGQPFVSPAALRRSLHSALWHAVHAVDQAGADEVLDEFDAQLAELRAATAATVAGIEAPSIAARKADVSERLADAVRHLRVSVPDDGGAPT